MKTGQHNLLFTGQAFPDGSWLLHMRGVEKASFVWMKGIHKKNCRFADIYPVKRQFFLCKGHAMMYMSVYGYGSSSGSTDIVFMMLRGRASLEFFHGASAFR